MFPAVSIGAAAYPQRAMVIAIDGPAGAGSQPSPAASRARSASPISTPGRCTAASRWRRCGRGADLDDAERDRRARRGARDRRSTRAGCCSAARTSARRSARRRSPRRPRGSRLTRGARGDGRPQRELIDCRRLRGRGTRHRHRRQPGRAAQGLPRRQRRRAGAPARRRRPASPSPSVLAAQSERDAPRPRARARGAARRADDAVELDTTGLGVDEVVERVVELARERGLGRNELARLPGSPSSASRTSASRTLVNRLAGGREAVVHSEAGRHPRPQGARVRVERRRAST